MLRLLRLCYGIGVVFLVPALAYPAVLGIPGNGSYLSGIGVISGWKCQANGRITVRFDAGDPIPLAYPTERPDTAGICGDTNNGFVAIMNWAELGRGRHTAVAYDNDVAFAWSTFTVETLGLERKFVRNASAFFCASDFPERGETALFVWNDATQHMELQAGPVAGQYVYDDLEGRASSVDNWGNWWARTNEGNITGSTTIQEVADDVWHFTLYYEDSGGTRHNEYYDALVEADFDKWRINLGEVQLEYDLVSASKRTLEPEPGAPLREVLSVNVRPGALVQGLDGSPVWPSDLTPTMRELRGHMSVVRVFNPCDPEQ